MTSLEKRIRARPDAFRIVHYACSSFDQNPVQVACIAISDVQGNVEVFSRTTKPERDLLAGFEDWLRNNAGKTLVVWNATSDKYGIPAIRRRHEQVFKKSRAWVNPTQVIDLDQVLTEKYGIGYCDDPKLWRMMEENLFTTTDFLSGGQEVASFAAGDWKRIENSCIRKTRSIRGFLMAYATHRLKIPRPVGLGRLRYAITFLFRVAVPAGQLVDVVRT